MMDYEHLFHEDNMASMKEWVVKTFKRRECVSFVPSKSLNQKCGCGRRFEEHKKLKINKKTTTAKKQIETIIEEESKKDKVWRIQDNTELFPTNAYGTIEFQGADIYTTKAEYIRLSFDTQPQNIIKLIKNYWQLELPKLIISVHGGIANYGLQTKLKQAIQRGLIKVANTSQIWIITAGTDTGVVKHIGDILKDNYPKSRNNVIEIGIAPWGVVNDRETLIGHGIEVPYYSNHRTVNLVNGFNLNNCHSYFLLVDDGTVGKYGCEISFRRRFERYLSRHKSEIFMDFDLRPKVLDVHIDEKITLQNHHTIPLVCLVIEGGTNTIQTVLVNVNDTPPVPVVVCDGSGRAADLIAFTHKYVYINPVTKKPNMDVDIQEQLITTIMKTFAYTKEQANYLFIQLMNCVKNKDLISIYRLGDEDNQEIDLAILTASLKVIDLDLNKQFDTIMSWNRPDIAKKYILLQGSEQEKQILQEKMFDALSQDKVEFVKLLLEYGVNLQKFLTFKRLQDLYNCKKGPSNTLILIIKDVVKKIDSNYKSSLIDIGLVVEKLIGSGYVSEYSKREFKARYMKYLNISTRNNLTTPSQSNKDNNHNNNNNESYTNEDVFKYPYNELLIWAVLMKRHKMAMFVCKRGEETMAKALVACKLNKALAREAELDDLESEVSDEFKSYAEEFSNLAVGLLDKCYKEDDELTSQLLTYDLVNFSHWTCLNLAVVANHKDFLSHPACQLLISDLWMGGMKIRKYVTFKVITALVFPPAIFAIQFKSAKELQYMPQTQEEYEHDLENQDSHSNSSNSDTGSNLSNSIIKLNDLNKNIYESNQFIDDDENKNNNLNKMLNLDQIIELYDAKNYEKANNKINNDSKVIATTIVDQFFSDDLITNNNNDRKKNTINFLVKNRTNKLKFGKKIYEFYNAPITKFWQNTFFYVAFLMCFAYIVLAKTPEKPNLVEIFVLVYIFSYGIDKIRELLQTDSSRFSGKIKIFFSRVMNVLDMFFIITIFIALIFRISPFKEQIRRHSPNYDSTAIARLIYCVNTIYWIVKFMEFLLINKNTGILIIIASKMLVDLFNFIIILIILLMSFGLSRQAIKYPNEEFSLELIKKIFLEPYFMLYGEVYADTIDPPCSPESPMEPQCQPGHWITPVTMTAFMIISCLLFLTVLIASFNNTFVRISRQSAQFWKCQRYHFVTAYESKPIPAPPLVVFSHIYMVVKYMIRLCQGKKIKFDRKLKAFLSDDMIQRLHDFEENCFYEYNCDMELSMSNTTDEKINQTREKVESICARIDDIFFKENVTKLSLYKVELRLQKLEEFNYEAINQLNNLCNLLRNNSNTNLDEDNDLSTLDSLLNLKTSVKRKRTVTISDTNQLIYEDNNDDLNLNDKSFKMNSRVNRSVSSQSSQTSQQNNMIKLYRNNSSTSNELRKRTTKINDNNNDLELKYLKKVSQKINKKDDNNISSSSSSSDDETAQEAKAINRKNKLDKQNEIDDAENSNEDEDLVRKISSNQLLQNQMSIGLDQYTIHPFVYLPSVVRPPIAEYTSITDCIDTSNIDRPPSPPISTSIANKYNMFLSEPNKSTTAMPTAKENSSSNKLANDYCSGESARSIVARQESEILRLAEESQHVIINQLLNNIVKKTDGTKSKLNKKPKVNEEVLVEDDREPILKQSVLLNEENEIKNQQVKEKVKTKSTQKKTDQQQQQQQQQFMLSFTSSSSSAASNNTPCLKHNDDGDDDGSETKNDKTKLLISNNKKILSSSKIPLNPIDRKSSQIFYAQSQANTLCLHIDDDADINSTDTKNKDKNSNA